MWITYIKGSVGTLGIYQNPRVLGVFRAFISRYDRSKERHQHRRSVPTFCTDTVYLHPAPTLCTYELSTGIRQNPRILGVFEVTECSKRVEGCLICSEHKVILLLHKVPVNSVYTPVFHNKVDKKPLWMSVDKIIACVQAGFAPFVDKFPQPSCGVGYGVKGGLISEYRLYRGFYLYRGRVLLMPTGGYPLYSSYTQLCTIPTMGCSLYR